MPPTSRLVKKQVICAAEILGDDPTFWDHSRLAFGPNARLRVEDIVETSTTATVGLYRTGRLVRLSRWDPQAQEPKGEPISRERVPSYLGETLGEERPREDLGGELARGERMGPRSEEASGGEAPVSRRRGEGEPMGPRGSEASGGVDGTLGVE